MVKYTKCEEPNVSDLTKKKLKMVNLRYPEVE